MPKLKSIARYYSHFEHHQKACDEIDSFVNTIRKVRKAIQLSDGLIQLNYTPIFEGAQGILLDRDFGVFPNVTRSNTTSKNALKLYPFKEIYYVTRSYLTRHGNGFLPDEKPLKLINNKKETNTGNRYQGKFRTAELNTDLLNYALQCDSHFAKGGKKNLVVTCMDQYELDLPELLKKLPPFDKVFISRGDSLDDISQIY